MIRQPKVKDALKEYQTFAGRMITVAARILLPKDEERGRGTGGSTGRIEQYPTSPGQVGRPKSDPMKACRKQLMT